MRTDGTSRTTALLTTLILSGPLAAPASGQGLLHQWHGSAVNESFGEAVQGVGDVNGDGFDDLIVGSTFPDPGRAMVFSGQDESLLYLFQGSSQVRDHFGEAVHAAGDVNLDGVLDIQVGAPLFSDSVSSGRAFVFSGVDGALLHLFEGPGSNHRLGSSLDSAGDLNGDGHDDLIVGARGFGSLPGYARVFSGQDGSVMHEFVGVDPGGRFGGSVGNVGDVNDDGVDDLGVGAASDESVVNDGGSIRVFSGVDGSVLHSLFGAEDDHLGIGVDRLGDIDGDGHDDVLVGAADSARVFSGNSGAEIYRIAGPDHGNPISRTGDLDGDGVEEFLLGAPRAGAFGVVEVRSGTDGSIQLTLEGHFPFHKFGEAVGHAGDVNGDGVPDLILGDEDAVTAGNRVGGAFVHSGTCGAFLSYGSGCPGSGGFVPQLSLSGCATPGAAITLELADARGGGLAFLLAGPGGSSIALAGGCTLLTFPFSAVYPLPVSGTGPGNGWISLTTELPITMATGTAYLQAMVEDQDHWRGFALTNGVRIDVR